MYYHADYIELVLSDSCSSFNVYTDRRNAPPLSLDLETWCKTSGNASPSEESIDSSVNIPLSSRQDRCKNSGVNTF